MILKDTAFAIVNGRVNFTNEDQIEAYQFINDNGYVDELTPTQTLFLKSLVESNLVFSPVAVVDFRN